LQINIKSLAHKFKAFHFVFFEIKNVFDKMKYIKAIGSEIQYVKRKRIYRTQGIS